MPKKKKLFDQFPPVSTREWMDKITADLKGADFKKMIWKTGYGIDVMPFYREEDMNSLIAGDALPGEFPFRRGAGTGNSWLVRQDITVSDYHEANSRALDILMRGVDSLGFIFKDPESVSIQNFKILLKDIHPEAVELNFLSAGKAKEILQILKDVCFERGINPAILRGAIEADPLGRLMTNGTLCVTPDEGFDYLADLTKGALSLPEFRNIHIKASEFGNAGADLVQELAFALSMGNEYMARLTDRGLTGEEAASKIRFCFSTGSDYFPEIAKLRAGRLLWSLVLKGYCKGACPGMKIHCVTSKWNMTVYDPYVNMLRTQTEAMSAVLGGADSLTVEPFDSTYKNPDAFSERIARNQQLILKEEACFDKVTDPSAGSYYIEKLTDMLADAAWKLYVETEERGGFLKALQDGFIQKAVSDSADRNLKDVSVRKRVLLGTNQYPNPRESMLDKLDGFEHEATVKSSSTDVVPIRPSRGAVIYEKLRIDVEASAKTPHVFLLLVGNPVMRKARAQFSSVFFSCGGYKVTEPSGFETAEEGISSAIDSRADIVVICSSDEEYATMAPVVYNNLKGSCIVVVAGNPACSEELKKEGIEYFIHLRSDVPATLKYFNSKLGINHQ